jgi:aminomethyltransferase
MVDFAGFDMPVLYAGQSHIESHNWVRSNAGLFDVSHMLQHRFSGPGAVEMLEKVTPSDLKGLQPFTSTLSVLLNEEGGIVDDTIISKHGENDFYVVTNAGCREKDLEFFSKAIEAHGKGDIHHNTIGGGLLALQGPKAAEILQTFTDYNLADIKFGASAFVPLLGGDYHVARGGYTGEDGFEISIPDDTVAVEFAEKLLDTEVVKPIGLAARDSLRLEAGMCLYGHELSEKINPVEAALAWVIGKRRRTEKGFNGADKILDILANKKGDLRVGLITQGPAAREGVEIYAKDDGDEPIGVITSGSMSPTLGKNIAMGYVPRAYAKSGTELQVKVRGKLRPAQVAKLPFVTPKYYK